MIAQHTQPYRPPSSLVAAVPAAVDEVILTSLATDPARRYPDLEALRAAMRAVG